MKEAIVSENLSFENKLKRFGPLLLVAMGLIGLYVSGAAEFFTTDALRDNIGAIDQFVLQNLALALSIYVFVYVLAVSTSFPGASFLTIAGGAFFGTFWGGMATVFAATIGASIIFLIARSALGDALEKKAGNALARLRDGFQKDAFNYLLTLRLAPIVPFWITNIAPAFFGMDLRRYVLATALGIIPGTFAFAYIGQIIGDVLRQIGSDADVNFADLARPALLSLGVLALVSFIPIIVKFVRKKKS